VLVRTFDGFSNVDRFVYVGLDDSMRLLIRRSLVAVDLVILTVSHEVGQLKLPREVEVETKERLTSFSTLPLRKLNGFAGISPC